MLFIVTVKFCLLPTCLLLNADIVALPSGRLMFVVSPLASVIFTVAPVKSNASPYLIAVLFGCVTIFTLDILSFTIIVCCAVFPSYVNLIICVPFTSTLLVPVIFVKFGEFTSACVSLIAKPGVVFVIVFVAPLFVTADNVNPAKFSVSPWSYSPCVIGVATDSDWIGSFTVILKVVSWPLYSNFTFGLFTSAGDPVFIVTAGSVMSMSSVVWSSYVTWITPPVRSIVSPWSYAVFVGFVFTAIDTICFSAWVNPCVANGRSLLIFTPDSFV